MRILMLFDVANDLYWTALALRERGVDVEMIIPANTFGMGHPLWAILDRDDINPYAAEWGDDDLEALPPWIHLWESSGLYPVQMAKLFQMMHGYDLIIGQPPSAIYLPFQETPYVMYESGWMRRFPYDDTNVARLARLGYVKAGHIMMTNPDMFQILEKLPYMPPASFLPFVVDIERFRPRPVKRSKRFTVFSPTRIFWRVKGNDRLIHAFARFIKAGYDAHLLLVRWGVEEYIELTERLIQELNIQERVEWLPVMTSSRLAEAYNTADVIVDQFMVGSGAYVMLEGMASGKPVICYVDEKRYRDCYGESPPLLNARRTDEIHRALTRCADDKEYRSQVGREARIFVVRHHSPKNVAKTFIQIVDNLSNCPAVKNIPDPIPPDSKHYSEAVGNTLFFREKRLLELLPTRAVIFFLSLIKRLADRNGISILKMMEKPLRLSRWIIEAL